MSENIIQREEAETIIKEAIDDYVDIETLQSIIDLIHGSGEFMVVEDITSVDEEEE
jgi:hypothetical protein